MASPYSSQSASNYNATPPADDGSQVSTNRITWAGVKTKLADPVKTLSDNINTALVSAFGKVLGSNGVRSTAIDYTVVSGDQGKLIKVTASGVVITTPAAATVTSPFCFAVINNSSGSITVDGNASETIDGASTISIPSGAGATIETDGTNWFTHGQNYVGTISPPQGRITLTSGVPVLRSDVSAATSVYYTPFVGNLCPIYNGTIYQMRTFAELTLTLSANSNYAASTIYDLFIFDSSGTVTFGMGPAWSTLTAGSGARGTGAGTTELERKLGYWTNKVSMTARNGASTYTVAANQGTYVGTIYMDASNGQVSCLIAWGQSRKWGIWNAYNRKPIKMIAGDSTASWAASTTYTTMAQSNSAAGNTIATLVGLPEESIFCTFLQKVANGSTSNAGFIGIGVNSTTAASGTVGEVTTNLSGSITATVRAEHTIVPGIGINNINSLDATTTAATLYGTQAFMNLSTEYLG